MYILFYIYLFLLGLCFGSFANVIIYRLPLKISIVSPPSHCPACGKRLAVTDLIPVISYVFLRGRCHYCGAKISARYPLVEIVCGILFCFIFFVTGVSFSVIPLCLLAFILLCVSVIDAKTEEIPDGLLIFGAAVAAVWIISSFFTDASAPSLTDAILGALTGALPLFIFDRVTLLVLKKNGFGFGDVKLMAMAGLFLGVYPTFLSFIFAFILGGCYAVFLLVTGRASRGEYFAFGQFLSAGIILSLCFSA